LATLPKFAVRRAIDIASFATIGAPRWIWINILLPDRDLTCATQWLQAISVEFCALI